jgi:hypothetical protein
MGLVNLKTNLKSLKYGNDRPGGGSSNQPYIVTPIPDGLTYNGPDFLLRQGALQASLDDVSRLTKWFSDPLSVNGLLFTAKQELLERQNIPVPGTPNRIYLPTSTISQAGLNAVGGHLNKQGLDPFEPGYASGGRRGYYFSTLNQTLSDGLENRLTIAHTAKIANQPLGGLTINPFGITGPNDSANLLSYDGGPNAPLGLGTTNIKLAGNGAGLPRDRTNTYNVISQNNSNNVYAYDSELIYKQDSNPTDFGTTKVISQPQNRSTTLSNIVDYRAVINASSNAYLPATNYSEFNRETTYKTSTTFYRINNSDLLTDPNGSVSVDAINATAPISNPQEDLSDSDLIKFFFEVIDPKSSTPNSDYLFFRAYLNNMGDGFKAEWTPYKYVGRAENFYRYGGFTRDVSLSFTIYAHSREEMIPLYQKLNCLVGTTAPRYADNGYMLGNFIKLTVGTYFNSVPGIINNISLKPSFEAGWDINRNSRGLPLKYEDGVDAYKNTGYVGQVPRMIEVDLTFTPIHSFTPEYTLDLSTQAKNFINNNTAVPKTDNSTTSIGNQGINTPIPPPPGTQLNTTGLRSNINTFIPERSIIGVDNIGALGNFA